MPARSLLTSRVACPRVPYEPVDGYIPRYVSTNHVRLTEGQGTALKELVAGLRREDASLKNGRPVETRFHAVQWLLERVADGNDNTGAQGRAEEEAILQRVEALAAGVLTQHADADALAQALLKLLTSPAAYAEAMAGAEAFFAEHGGATGKHMAVLLPWLRERTA